MLASPGPAEVSATNSNFYFVHTHTYCFFLTCDVLPHSREKFPRIVAWWQSLYRTNVIYLNSKTDSGSDGKTEKDNTCSAQIWKLLRLVKKKQCKPSDHFRVICFCKTLQLICRLFLFLPVCVCLLLGFFEVLPMDLQNLHSALLYVHVELVDPTFAPFHREKCWTILAVQHSFSGSSVSCILLRPSTTSPFPYLPDLLHIATPSRGLGSSSSLYLPVPSSHPITMVNGAFGQLWNSLPLDIRNIDSVLIQTQHSSVQDSLFTLSALLHFIFISFNYLLLILLLCLPFICCFIALVLSS